MTNLLRVLYKTFWSFISIAIRRIIILGKIWNLSEKNVRVTIYLLQARALQDIIKAFEQSTVNHLVGKNEMSFIRSFDLTNIIPYIQWSTISRK